MIVFFVLLRAFYFSIDPLYIEHVVCRATYCLSIKQVEGLTHEQKIANILSNFLARFHQSNKILPFNW